MNNILEYKGYFAHVEYSVEDAILYGKIEGISDLVNFECSSASEVVSAFHQAVDDYLLFCEDIGQEPNKVYKGSFNIRISPDLHKAADIERIKQGISLNQLVSNALQAYLSRDSKETVITVLVPERTYSKLDNWDQLSAHYYSAFSVNRSLEVPYGH